MKIKMNSNYFLFLILPSLQKNMMLYCINEPLCKAMKKRVII